MSKIEQLKNEHHAFRICTMPNGDWFVSSLYPDLEELAEKAGGDIEGHDLGGMGELFDVPMSEDSDDPHDDLITAIASDPLHNEMLARIRAELTATA